MRDFIVIDDFGRRTTFAGEKLISESTDTSDNRKPQWVEVVVWRTKGESFVVQRTTHYRIRHTRDTCTRAEGYDLIDPTHLDTYPCPTCNTAKTLEGGCSQSSRISVEVYYTPEEIISSFRVDGRYNNLSKTILADLSEQDNRVDDAWNTVRVP